ncbi:SAM-dependent methyltransferase [Actinoalloteichus hoggarensis]|uniref:Ubiquinone biosynthesis O-methyltransferase n=1 Tax=Actinoalloteichus hoggarensis TaxID=1470176 RepID=A0A221W0X4_9PSEU|nr:methyltransferase domain-containing protein [Actinoalloteichus hoggarensis]ASO19434.1 Ubiquinone biosynthesis O-methyltransferase [Actinoalloteichus hoggarensis]MBB5919862.1 SAM-dependent methyltransferase [Actinoalloteichus hoggarensis]
MRSEAVHRVLIAELAAARARQAGRAPRVLDVGGGTGVWAVPIAASGCAVTVIDSSPDALATLRRRAADAGVADRVFGVQGDIETLGDLVPSGDVDLVLGHDVLEFVDDPAAALRSLTAVLVPGGAVSVLVSNRYAAVIQRTLAGRLDEACELLTDPAGRLGSRDGTPSRDPLLRRFDAAGLAALFREAGLTEATMQGDGVLSDLVPGTVPPTSLATGETLTELERAAVGHPALLATATRLHALGRRAADPVSSEVESITG